MDQLKLKNTLKNVGLMVLIVLILGYNFYYFLIAPKIANEAKIDQIVNSVDENAIFINQFNYKEATYFVRLDDRLIAVNDKGQTLDSMMYPTVDQHIKNELDHNNTQIQFGYVQERFVYVIKTNQIEKWIDIETKEIIYEKGSES